VEAREEGGKLKVIIQGNGVLVHVKNFAMRHQTNLEKTRSTSQIGKERVKGNWGKGPFQSEEEKASKGGRP